MFSLFNGTRSDYAPAYMGTEAQQLYFTSTRNQSTGDISSITAMKNGDIFFSKKDEKGKWKAVESAEGDINTDFDEGACSFTPDGKTMYLTICRTDPQYPRMAEIWTSTRGDAKWSKPSQVKITGDTLSSSHIQRFLLTESGCTSHPTCPVDKEVWIFGELNWTGNMVWEHSKT